MITPYVTITSRQEFSRNKTGFGYMVYDIAKAVSKLEQVDVLCTDSRGKEFNQDGIHFLERKWSNIFGNLLDCIPISLLNTLLRKYHPSKGASVRLLYYWLMSGYISQIIEKGNYDIIHIHGCAFSGTLWEAVCKRKGVKVLYTLHGLNSFSDTINMESAGKQYERDFLKQMIEGEKCITVISSGIKRVVEKHYRKPCSNMFVVNNFFSFTPSKGEKINIRKQYDIPLYSKIVLCIGNISKWKNQKQLVTSFGLMGKDICKNTYIFFLGGLQNAESMSKIIETNSWRKHFILCGSIDKELVPQYYEAGDAVALISLSEGFGLSLIEGMHFGLPCMTFTDIDAYTDIYSPDTVVGVKEHTDEAVAKGLELLLTTKWEKSAIIDHSHKFEDGEMAKKYIEVYKKIRL